MERLGQNAGPDILRGLIRTIEDQRQLANVDRLIRCPELDQQMMLALNGAIGEKSSYKNGLPEVGTVREGLKKRLIQVVTPDDNGAVLGIFYATINSLETHPEVVTGVFPLHHVEVDYILRPNIDYSRWKSGGEIYVRQESSLHKDPLLVLNSKGPNFLFFRKSPFNPSHPYRVIFSENWERESHYQLNYLQPLGLSLEENMIANTLCVARQLIEHGYSRYNPLNRGRSERPKLFKQTGFAGFINKHRLDPKYRELYEAFIHFRSVK